MIIADGHIAKPLGRVFELPIQFGPMVISGGAMVVDTDSYELVLGNSCLKKVQAILDFGALKIRFHWKRRTFDMPIDIVRGIRPTFVDDQDQQEYAITTIRRPKLKHA